MAVTGDPFDPTLVVFAALAFFVIWKLRSVLGVRVDVERDETPARFERRAPAGPAPLQGAAPYETPPAPQTSPSERWEGVVENGAAAASAGLDSVVRVDPKFDGKAFLDGARRAYEIIVPAFAKGDRDRLRGLLADDAFRGFDAEIKRRNEAGETLEVGVVAIDSARVEAARATPGNVEITVRYDARLMTVRRNSAGETIEGGHTTSIVEYWTFARDPRAANPNWMLVATRGEA